MNAFVDQAVAPHPQHGFVDVGVHHLAALADLLGKGQGQVARTAGDIQRALAFLQVGDHHGVLLPDAVQPTGHQVVHHVVLARNRIEHAAHFARLVLFINRLKSKVGGAHSSNASKLCNASPDKPRHMGGYAIKGI
ncbi:hypothetical protein D3C72_1509500 [compost metagenome]